MEDRKHRVKKYQPSCRKLQKPASTNTNSAARKYRANRKIVAKSTNHGIKTFKTSHQKCQRPRQTIPNIASTKYSKQPEILKPMPIRKLVDFIPNPFTKINIFAFCDQVPFWVHFKRHCTRQWLNLVSNLTVRTRLF